MEELNQSLPPGTRVAHYRIEERLGQGGFGMTYRARDIQLQRSVAIKEFIPFEFALRGKDDTRVQPRSHFEEQYRYGLGRFLDEARTLARFDHTNIIRVYGFLEANATAYLVMAFEQGETLADYLQRVNVLAEPELTAIAQSVFRGLKEVHRHEYLHRDIKPSNIYLRRLGEAVLIDFGAARQALGDYSRSVTGIVSPGYAPSEQYGNDPSKQGPWTDLYGVGATLYRCICGQSPVDAASRMYALMEGKGDPLVPAAEAGAGRYSAKWLQLVDWLLCPAGKDRPHSVDEVFARVRETSVRAGHTQRHSATETVIIPEMEQKTGNEEKRAEVNTPEPDDQDIAKSGESGPSSGEAGRRERFRWFVRDRRWMSFAILLIVGFLAYGLWWFFAPGQTGGPVPDAQGSLFVIADPPDAQVLFRNARLQYRPGMELRPGSYGLEVSRDGYRSSYPNVAIEADRVNRVSVNLTGIDPAKAGEISVKRPPRIATLPDLVNIDAGCFDMGSPDNEKHRSKTERLHRACVEKFRIARHEVTVHEFRRFVEATAYRTDAERGLGGKGCYVFTGMNGESGWSMRGDASWRELAKPGGVKDDHPVACVSWNDANAYIRWLNRETGDGYRLPSEAEWEYAARAGIRGADYWIQGPEKACRHANAADRTAGRQMSGWAVSDCDDGYAYLAPVGHYPSNRFGLFDMLGNAWEWTCSGVDLSYGGGEKQCEPSPAAWHIVRGGSWAGPPEELRFAYRSRNASSFRSDTLGFRLAR